jgi:hypothetical protein
MSVTANLTTNVETITATIVVEDETIIAQVSAAARGPAGEAGAAGAAGPNTVTTATTTNLTGFVSGDGTNIAGATAATSTATANTLVLRDGSGGASLEYPTFGSGFQITETGGSDTFGMRSATGDTWSMYGPDYGDFMSFSKAGVINFSPSGFAYGASAASAHRTALGLGTGDSPTFAGATFTGELRFSPDDTYNIGQAANFRPRRIWSSFTMQSAFLTATGNFVAASDNGKLVFGLNPDTFIGRDGAANTLAQRNGTAQQESRIYGTYTDGSNYRRLALKMSNAGVAQIVAEGGGSGASGNRIEIDGLRIGKGGSNIATNTALGASALNANTTGNNSIAVGYEALLSNTTGGRNSAVGYYALRSNTTGGNNTAVGFFSLQNNTTGASNSAVGHNAGRFIANGATANAITNNSVYLGADTKALASNQTNQIVIGYDAIGLGSNTAVLGNDSIETTALKGDVGIGTTSPTAMLDVDSDTVRVRTARTPASAAADGNAGDICWDADYIYVCTATDTWKRAAISTW